MVATQPPFLTLSTTSDTLPADGSISTTLTAFLRDARGQVLSSDDTTLVSFSVTNGQALLSQNTVIANNGLAKIQVRGLGVAGAIRIRAQASYLESAEIELQTRAAAAHHIELVAVPASIVADRGYLSSHPRQSRQRRTRCHDGYLFLYRCRRHRNHRPTDSPAHTTVRLLYPSRAGPAARRGRQAKRREHALAVGSRPTGQDPAAHFASRPTRVRTRYRRALSGNPRCARQYSDRRLDHRRQLLYLRRTRSHRHAQLRAQQRRPSPRLLVIYGGNGEDPHLYRSFGLGTFHL